MFFIVRIPKRVKGDLRIELCAVHLTGVKLGASTDDNAIAFQADSGMKSPVQWWHQRRPGFLHNVITIECRQ